MICLEFDGVESPATGTGDRRHSKWRESAGSRLGNGPQFCRDPEEKSQWMGGWNRRLNRRCWKRARKGYRKWDRRIMPSISAIAGIFPFEDETFDVLMNQYLLDILPVEDFIPLLLEFKRVLKDGGQNRA